MRSFRKEASGRTEKNVKKDDGEGLGVGEDREGCSGLGMSG